MLAADGDEEAEGCFLQDGMSAWEPTLTARDGMSF